MAIDLDISKSYFHQIKAGDVPLPAKIAYKFAVMFNVHPICLMDDSLPLLDCEGKEYTIKSYKDRNQQQENLNHELKNLIDSLAAPSNGALAVIKACLLTHMRDIVNQMDGLQYKFEDRFKVPIPATTVLSHHKNLRLVAQWSEQGTHNSLVGGSNPSGPTNFRACIP